MDALKRSPEFDLAYRFVTETNNNVFLTGKAGTGKTTFLKYLRDNGFKKMVVAAPTGVATINAGGVTLHSLFQLPFAPFIPSKEKNEQAINKSALLSQTKLSGAKLNLLRNLELLIIDEVSMVPSHTIDAVDTILRSVRRRHNMPFGGVQVLFIGDLHQLQPVVKNDEWQFLQEYYSSIFFFDSHVLQEHPPVMIELKEIYRQRDQQFVDVLNEIRHNDLTQQSFDLLNTRLNRNYFPKDNDGYITLTTHVRQSDEINRLKLQRLNTNAKTYKAEIKGDFAEHLYPADATLELKEGAQIMFLKNDTEGKKYFNGKIGIVTKLYDSAVHVKCNDETEIEVKKVEWKNNNYKLNKETREVTEEYLGSFIQFPLRLAWAITIHKSQGLTFDKVVIDSEKAFANGQVYVALSRCTSLEGLILTSPINQRFLGAHGNLEEWNATHRETNLQQRFNDSRSSYVIEELQHIFTWNKWSDDLKDLNGVIYDLRDDLPTPSVTWIKQLIESQKEIRVTADKFKDWMIQQCRENPEVEQNQPLQQRLKNAADYFSKEMEKWMDVFRNHPLIADTKKVSRQIDALLEEINGTMAEQLHKINFCRNGFALDDYLKRGKKLTSPVVAVKSSYEGNQSESVEVATELMHPALYHKIADMRKRIVNEGEKPLPLYMVFSSNAIKNVCRHLPGNKEALMQVKGFGKAKVSKYGDEVIELVLDYCSKNKIEPNHHLESTPRIRKPREPFPSVTPDTAMISLDLFKAGKNVNEIAAERNLSVSTIEGHLAKAIGNGLINIEEVMDMKEVEQLAAYFPGNLDDIRLGEVKSKAPADVTYGKLTLALAWLKLQTK